MDYNENQILRMLKPSQVESGRAVFFRYLANDAWAMLSKDERFKSVTYYIAQFWNDNANDEIHLRAFASVHPEVVGTDLGRNLGADRANVGLWRGQPHSKAQNRYWFTPLPCLRAIALRGQDKTTTSTRRSLPSPASGQAKAKPMT